MTIQQQKNGIRLSWATLITAITAVGLCVAAFTTVGARANQNYEDIAELKIYVKETSQVTQENAIILAVIAAKMGIDPNTNTD